MKCHLCNRPDGDMKELDINVCHRCYHTSKHWHFILKNVDSTLCGRSLSIVGLRLVSIERKLKGSLQDHEQKIMCLSCWKLSDSVRQEIVS
jgi:hypothetical protein